VFAILPEFFFTMLEEYGGCPGYEGVDTHPICGGSNFLLVVSFACNGFTFVTDIEDDVVSEVKLLSLDNEVAVELFVDVFVVNRLSSHDFGPFGIRYLWSSASGHSKLDEGLVVGSIDSEKMN
jgi:hypothetical protein